MSYQPEYAVGEPDRASIDARGEPLLLEFGAPWCPHCSAVQSDVRELLQEHETLAHFKIYDAKHRPLGRSFGVKLWPTFVLVQAGRELARVVRPTSQEEFRRLFDTLAADRTSDREGKTTVPSA